MGTEGSGVFSFWEAFDILLSNEMLLLYLSIETSSSQLHRSWE